MKDDNIDLLMLVMGIAGISVAITIMYLGG